MINPHMLKSLFYVLCNIDAHELADAGVIKNTFSTGGCDWARFNKDIATFVIKLPADRLEKLCTLVAKKQEELGL